MREYSVYQDAEQQQMPHAWHLSREIQSARRHTSAAEPMVLLRAFERSGSIYAKVANGRLASCARGFANDNSVVRE